MRLSDTRFYIVVKPLTLNEVYEALFSKEKMKQLVVGPEAQEDSLFVHGRP